MDARTVYRSAMRCYRLAVKAKHTDDGNSVQQFNAAVSLVRSVTGKWDIPILRHPVHYWQVAFERPPCHRYVVVNQAAADFGAASITRRLAYKPGRLWVRQAHTQFCRRTRDIPDPWRTSCR